MEQRFITTEQLADRWHTSPKGIAEMRHRGSRPRGHRIGKRVLYSLADVEAFESKRADAAA